MMYSDNPFTEKLFAYLSGTNLSSCYSKKVKPSCTPFLLSILKASFACTMNITRGL